MTDTPDTEALVAEMREAGEVYLLIKRGLYYRPNGQGYTGLKDDAGRYDFERAKQHHSPEDGVTYIHEDEARECSPKCAVEIVAEHMQGKLEALSKELAEARDESFERSTQLLKALVEIGRLRDALKWYGEQARLSRLIHCEGDARRHALSNDGGKKARAALKGTTHD